MRPVAIFRGDRLVVEEEERCDCSYRQRKQEENSLAIGAVEIEEFLEFHAIRCVSRGIGGFRSCSWPSNQVELMQHDGQNAQRTDETHGENEQMIAAETQRSPVRQLIFDDLFRHIPAHEKAH